MRAARWRRGESLEPLCQVVRRGGVLAIPTESSYGLGADPASETGVRAIYDIKGREAGKPLPVVVGSVEQAFALGVSADAPGLALLARVWPAPVSLLVPTSRALPAAAGSGLLAIRVPADEALRDLLLALGIGLTATSANRSGEPPLLDPDRVAALLGDRDAVVVVGERPLPGGAPSTVVSWAAGALRVERHGRLSEAHLRSLVAARENGGGGFSAAGVEITVDKSCE